jgi:hypothetical protein
LTKTIERMCILSHNTVANHIMVAGKTLNIQKRMDMGFMSSYNNENCGLSTCCLGLVLGVIAAVIFGILFFFGLIPEALGGILIVLELAVVLLVLLFVGAYLSEAKPSYYLSRCLCRHAACLLAGIIGTIVAATIALSILIVPGLVSSAIAVAVVAFFYVLMLTETVGFLLCFACKAHRCKEGV